MAVARKTLALPPPFGIDVDGLRVQPMTVRCDYLLSATGHRMVGSIRGEQVIDTGWHTTAVKAAAEYGRQLGPVAADRAARYLA